MQPLMFNGVLRLVNYSINLWLEFGRRFNEEKNGSPVRQFRKINANAEGK